MPLNGVKYPKLACEGIPYDVAVLGVTISDGQLVGGKSVSAMLGRLSALASGKAQEVYCCAK